MIKPEDGGREGEHDVAGEGRRDRVGDGRHQHLVRLADRCVERAAEEELLRHAAEQRGDREQRERALLGEGQDALRLVGEERHLAG